MADKYIQIAYEIESELRRMRADGIVKLPTEEAFCDEYSCSRQTIRAALKVLTDKGLIVKKRGSGSYIADDDSRLHDTVVFITGDKFENSNPELISQLTDSLKSHKFKFKSYSSEFSFTKEKEILTEVLGLFPAAVIIEPSSNIIPSPNIAVLEEISAKGIPVVYLYSAYPVPTDAICIRENDTDGAMKLISHLRERGHKKLSCVFRCDSTRGLSRYKGYIEACRQFGMEFDEHNTFLFTGRDRKKMIMGNDEFLKTVIDETEQDCTAIVCHNDEVAYRLIRIIENRGINVPKDLAVLSWENNYSCSAKASLTSLGHSEKDLVNTIVKTVIAAINHKSYKPEPLTWKLHVRNSG